MRSGWEIIIIGKEDSVKPEKRNEFGIKQNWVVLTKGIKKEI